MKTDGVVVIKINSKKMGKVAKKIWLYQKKVVTLQ